MYNFPLKLLNLLKDAEGAFPFALVPAVLPGFLELAAGLRFNVFLALAFFFFAETVVVVINEAL